MKAVETQLEPDDYRDAQAVTDIASWFYGNLYAVTIDANKQPSTTPTGAPTSPPSTATPLQLPARPTSLRLVPMLANPVDHP